MIKNTKKKNKAEDTEYEKIIKKFDNSKNYWRDIHRAYIEDQNFVNGDQWDEKVKKERDNAGLSSLNYNNIPAKVKFIVNNAAANTPNIKVNPISEGASKNTAKVFDGLIKHIQYKYNAKSAYINGLDNAVCGGIGAWRVLPISLGEDELGQPKYDIEVIRITDPTSVYFDPNAKRQNYSDAEFCFISTWIAKEEFEEKYPDESIGGIGEHNTSMLNDDKVQILEYWSKNRDTKLVEQYILNGDKILEHIDDYRGSLIPIIMVTGSEKYIQEKVEFKGIVRDIKDIQMFLNLTKSRTADYISRSAQAQWLAEEEQIAGYKEFWFSQNVNGIPVLPYKATEAGAPIQKEAPAPPTGFMQVSAEADNDIRAAIGIRDPLADIPQTQSGKAIALQISQGNIGTFQFIDHLNAAIKWTGAILVDLIPMYFNYPHIREIMGIDGQVSTVQLGQPYIENGQEVMHDLSKGTYMVTISEGPSYESQRSEASDKLLELVKEYPQFMQLAGDIVFRNMDFDGAQEIADRLKASIPPNILAASSASNADSNTQTQMLMSQMNQMKQQMDAMNAQLQQAQQLNQQLNMEKQAKITEIETKGKVDANLKTLAFEHEMNMEHLRIHGTSKQIAEKGVVDIDKLHEEAKLDANMHDKETHADIFKTQMAHDLNQFRDRD